MFIGGDFNINMRQPNSFLARKLNRFLKLQQLKQFVNEITRQDSKATLDLIISKSDIISDTGIININVSDHLPIYIFRKKVKIPRPQVSFTGRSYKKLTLENIQLLLEQYDWIILALKDVDSCWEYMSLVFFTNF